MYLPLIVASRLFWKKKKESQKTLKLSRVFKVNLVFATTIEKERVHVMRVTGINNRMTTIANGTLQLSVNLNASIPVNDHLWHRVRSLFCQHGSN